MATTFSGGGRIKVSSVIQTLSAAHIKRKMSNLPIMVDMDSSNHYPLSPFQASMNCHLNSICKKNDLIFDFWCFNATFNNISAISWRPLLVVEEAGVPGENHRPWASNW
jgi:hypothetical protein